MRPSLIGICHLWIRHVRLTKAPHEFIKEGEVGDLEVTETSVDGQVIHALFHPAGRAGFSLVINPEWEYLPEPSVV